MQAVRLTRLWCHLSLCDQRAEHAPLLVRVSSTHDVLAQDVTHRQVHPAGVTLQQHGALCLSATPRPAWNTAMVNHRHQSQSYTSESIIDIRGNPRHHSQSQMSESVTDIRINHRHQSKSQTSESITDIKLNHKYMVITVPSQSLA